MGAAEVDPRVLFAAAIDRPLLERAIDLARRGLANDAIAEMDAFLAVNADQRLQSLALTVLGGALILAQRPAAAHRVTQRAIRLDPRNVTAHTQLAKLLRSDLQRREDVLLHAEEAARLQPGDPRLKVRLLASRLAAAVWDDFDSLWRDAHAAISDDPTIVDPLTALQLGVPPTVCRETARAAARAYLHHPPLCEATARGHARASGDERITVGYLSNDFRNHPTAYLLVRALEMHDRGRFRIIAYSTCAPEPGPVRKRLVATVDGFVELHQVGSSDAAGRIHADGVDVLVDLHGFTHGARPDILAHRPAPVQVAYLGFPGTVGAPWIDYAIVDPVVAPPGSDALFDEALIRIGCYQPNDDRPRVGPPTTRADQGLPDQAVVYACFNNLAKITPMQFRLFMRVLAQVPRGVLWMLAPPGPRGIASIRSHAAAAGIDPDRIILAPFAGHPAHLSRLTLADIVLDTWPYNAHTTASDALGRGVPVVTCATDWFPGRVAASLLTTVGLTGLIARDANHYVGLAAQLGLSAAIRSDLRRHLETTVLRSRLFDARTHARELEAAYRWMVDRWRAGLPPTALTIAESKARPTDDTAASSVRS